MRVLLKVLVIPLIMYLEWYLFINLAFSYLGLSGHDAVQWPMGLTLVAIWVVSTGYICDL